MMALFNLVSQHGTPLTKHVLYYKSTTGTPNECIIFFFSSSQNVGGTFASLKEGSGFDSQA